MRISREVVSTLKQPRAFARANSRRAIAKPLLTGPLCLLLAGGLLACKPQEPVYDTDVDVGDQGQPLLPTGMFYVYGDELMRGRVRDPDLSHLVPPTPEDESAGGADLPSKDVAAIRTTLSDVFDLAVEGEWEEIPSYFVPSQAEQLEKFVPLIKPLMDKSKELEAALGDQAGAGMPGGMPTDPKAVIAMLKPMLNSAKVSARDASHATMALSFPLMGEPLELPFTRIEDEWYIEIPDFPPAEVLDQIRSTVEGVLPGILQKMDEVLTKAKEGSINAMQAQIELQQALMPIMMQIMGTQVGPGGGPPERTDASPAGTLPKGPITGPTNLDFEGTFEESGLPTGWVGVGNGYERSVDQAITHDGSGSGRIRYVGPDKANLATFAQFLPVEEFKGKRIRYTGYLRTEDVSLHAGLWLSAENSERQLIANDNMQDRSVVDTTEWKVYEIVLEIPDQTKILSFGAMLVGTGTLWIDDLNIEVVED